MSEYRPQHERPGFVTASIGVARRPDTEEQRELAIPEHGLLHAMIERAIMDVAHPAKNDSASPQYICAARRHQRDALEWIFDYPESTERWSFDWVCEHLDIEPNHMRAAIKVLVENNIKLAFRNRQCAAPMYKAA